VLPNVLEVARRLIRERVKPTDVVVDATMGNGNDTLFLCQCIDQNGLVIAYDIQEAALLKTKARLEREGISTPVEFHLESHEGMKKLRTPVGAIMFNLGYLPGGDKDITTKAESTVRAIEAGLAILRPGGIMTIVLYWGHPAGEIEKEVVEKYCATLDQSEFLVLKYQYLNQKNQAPYLLAVEKRGM